MANKRWFLTGGLVLGLTLSGYALNSYTGKPKNELTQELAQLKEENLKLKQQIEELNLKIDLLLSRIEKLEKTLAGQARSSDSFEEKQILPKEINPGTNLPVVKVEVKAEEQGQGTKKVIEIIDEDKKKEIEIEKMNNTIEEAKKLIANKKYAEAEKLIKTRLQVKVEPKEGCSLYYYLAESQSLMNKNTDAVKTYIDLSDKYPVCEYASEAMFKAGEIYEKMGEREKARKLYQDLRSLYPFSKYANLAEKKLKE